MRAPVDVPVKAPNAIKPYNLDWSQYLNGDTIATSTWPEYDAGINKDSETRVGAVTTVWVSGGAVGGKYRFVNRIVTAAGITDEQTIVIPVERT